MTTDNKPPLTNQGKIENEAQERAIKKMQITHDLTGKMQGFDFSEMEMERYGEVVFGSVFWKLVGGWVQDEYEPYTRSGQDLRAAIMICFHRILKGDGERRFTTDKDMEFLQTFKYPDVLKKIALDIYKTDKNPHIDTYVVTESEVEEMLKNC